MAGRRGNYGRNNMISCFNNIYKKRNVFVTGHTGFKGSWLTTMLHESGANITGYSLEPSTDPSLFEILKLKDKIKHITADVRDRNEILKAMKSAKPEFVFHLAAQPIVRLSYEEPAATFETNIMGVVNLLEACRELKSVRAVLIVTSDKCYENREWVYAYRENDPMGGYDPYSSSKGCAELVVSAYRNSFFNVHGYGKNHKTSLASVRAGNIIGGGDWTADRLIPDIVKSIISKKPLVLRNPDSVRPWQHVLEPVAGYLYLASRMYNSGVDFSEGFNFGPASSDILTVEEIVKKSCKIWGDGKYKIKSDKKLHEARLLRLDTGKSQFKLGWKPVYNANEAIEKTMQWYREYYTNKKIDMYDYTAGYIKQYIDEALRSGLDWIK